MKKLVFEFNSELLSHDLFSLKLEECEDNYILDSISFLGTHYNSIEDIEDIEVDYLSEENFTSILRVASLKKNNKYLFPNLIKKLEILGLKPLPIKAYVSDIEGKDQRVDLHDYQISAIEHIRMRECLSLEDDNSVHDLKGGILKLEMGLGKTLVSIVTSLITPKISCSEKYPNGFPTLIVASKTVMDIWKVDGFEKFFSSTDVKVLYFHRSYMTEREMDSISRKELLKYDFIVTTYDFISGAAKIDNEYEKVCIMGDDHTLMKGKVVAIRPKTKEQCDNAKVVGKKILFYTPWERIFCDESHSLNPTTFLFKAVMCLYGEFRHCLTGTPIKNYETDIWAQLRFCGYSGTEDKNIWKHQGRGLMVSHKLKEAVLSIDYADTKIILPPTLYIDESVVMCETEQRVYDFVLGVTKNVFDMMTSRQVNFASVLALFTKLRQICIAPYLITTQSKRGNSTYSITKNDIDEDIAGYYLKDLETKEELWSWVKNRDGTAGIQSSKMSLILNTIRNIPKGDKVLIFSSFTSLLDLLGYALNKKFPGYKFRQMDGDVNQNQRKKIIQDFRDEECQINALLLTYKVGSEGLNLANANHVICVEPWWTPIVTKQAVSRCRRMGQTKKVFVYNLFLKDTVEDRIIEKCKAKLEMAECYLEGTKRDKIQFKKELASILGI
jgi:SNF2 family DNA or RNA helicase